MKWPWSNGERGTFPPCPMSSTSHPYEATRTCPSKITDANLSGQWKFDRDRNRAGFGLWCTGLSTPLCQPTLISAYLPCLGVTGPGFGLEEPVHNQCAGSACSKGDTKMFYGMFARIDSRLWVATRAIYWLISFSGWHSNTFISAKTLTSDAWSVILRISHSF